MAKALINAIFMVAGVAIGGAMVGLPASLVAYGPWWSIVALCIGWVVMTLTALLTFEVALRCPKDGNFLSMAATSVGKTGQVLTAVTYVILLYALMCAYLSASSDMLADLSSRLGQIKPIWSQFAIACIMVLLVMRGIGRVATLNRWLMLMLLVLFVGMMTLIVGQASGHVQQASSWNIQHGKHSAAVVVVLTSFAFHIIIPSLRNASHTYQAMLPRAMIYGGGLAMIVYSVWILGVMLHVPTEVLLKINQGQLGSQAMLTPMFAAMHQSRLVPLGHLFILLAVMTSFLGVMTSLSDFIKDWVIRHKKHKWQSFSAIIAVLPSLCLVVWFPHGFIAALTYAGVMVAFLHGVLPVWMALALRRKTGVSSTKLYQTPGPDWLFYSIAIAMGSLALFVLVN